MRSAEIEVVDPDGLHARPAALFVRTAARSRSKVSVVVRGEVERRADAKSMLAVLGLGVRQGSVIGIEVDGEDEDVTLEALLAVVRGATERRRTPSPPTAGTPLPAAVLGPSGSPRSDGAPPTETPVATSRTVAGVAGAGGIAIGEAWIVAAGAGVGRPGPTGAASPLDALDAAAARLEALARRAATMGRDDQAGILRAQAELARDPGLRRSVEGSLASGATGLAALGGAGEAHAALLAALPDPVLAARAADVRDVCARAARVLVGDDLPLPERPVVLVGEDVPPSLLAEIPPEHVLGIVTAAGSVTAHVVILARALGVPAVVGARGVLEAVAPGTPLVVDGDAGVVTLRPAAAEREDAERRRAATVRRRAEIAAAPVVPGRTRDGHPVPLLANIGGPDEAQRALAAGAEGVGLFRTEFLFLDRGEIPSEPEQADAYRRAFAAFGPDRPVVVRLLDAGGDKEVPALGLVPGPNPFLGIRGVRLAAAVPEVLRTQVRAVIRAAEDTGVVPHLMAPMVATLDDLAVLRALVAEAGGGGATGVRLGVMIEVPSAVLLAPELATAVDFFSIGTNDLVQYLFAADRTEAALARYQDALHPALLRAVERVVAAAAAADIAVAVCGELASDPAGALVLVGLGVHELSMETSALGGIRYALGAHALSDLQEAARDALALRDAAAVRARVQPLVEAAALAAGTDDHAGSGV